MNVVLTIEAVDRSEWRAWLRENCDTADEVWLVIRHAAARGARHRRSTNTPQPR